MSTLPPINTLPANPQVRPPQGAPAIEPTAATPPQGEAQVQGGPTRSEIRPADRFNASPELAEKDGAKDRDVSPLLSALRGEAPDATQEELESAKVKGKSVKEGRQDKEQDQKILDHACNKGCGCGSSKPVSGDPLKSLRDRDDEVRKHELDHLHEAGEFAASGPIYETTTASDGKSYVTGGKVMVNIGEVESDPEKTIAKMEKVERAALKPAEPSDQDMRVAAEARTKRAKAQSELEEKQRKAGEKGEESSLRAA